MPREMLPAPEVGGGTALASAQGSIRISNAQEKRACIASADMPRYQRSRYSYHVLIVLVNHVILYR